MQAFVVAAPGWPVGRNQEVVDGESHCSVLCVFPFPVQPLDQLTDDVDQDVLVILGGPSQNGGRDLDVLVAVL